MKTVTSKDGTTIAFDQSGEGPVVVLVDGALQYRAFDQGMAQLADCCRRTSPFFTMIVADEATARIRSRMRSSVKSKISKPSSTKWVDRHLCMASPPARRLRWKRRSSSVIRSRNLPCMKLRTTMMRLPSRHGGNTKKLGAVGSRPQRRCSGHFMMLVGARRGCGRNSPEPDVAAVGIGSAHPCLRSYRRPR